MSCSGFPATPSCWPTCPLSCVPNCPHLLIVHAKRDLRRSLKHKFNAIDPVADAIATVKQWHESGMARQSSAEGLVIMLSYNPAAWLDTDFLADNAEWWSQVPDALALFDTTMTFYKPRMTEVTGDNFAEEHLMARMVWTGLIARGTTATGAEVGVVSAAAS